LKFTNDKIYTGDIPLGNIDPGDFRQLVVNEGVRPEQPDEEEAPQMTDVVWELAEKCWVKDPNQRPTATEVYDMISQMPKSVASSLPLDYDSRQAHVPSSFDDSAVRPALAATPPSSPIPNTTNQIKHKEHDLQISTIRLFPPGRRIATQLPGRDGSESWDDQQQVYCSLLYSKKLGFPIWRPDLSIPQKVQGIEIGDVGLMSADGSFDFLFNICAGPSGSINNGAVPDCFQQLRRELHHQPNDLPPGKLISGSLDIQHGESTGTCS
jgi:hypothetical protein